MTSPIPAYRADIDGLRAVAVLPVVFYHAGFSTFSGGFVGVDVFLVISGFLITSIIAREIESGDFRLANFYERRARRLFPALFAVLLAATIAALFLLMPGELEGYGESVAATSLFASNFLFFSEAGYFDGPAELKPLLHTWSLAIEEQYYLLFPGFLIVVRRWLPGGAIAWVGALFAASLAYSIWAVRESPDAAFYLLPSRTWELLLGSLLALLPAAVTTPSARWVREAGAALGVMLIGVAVFAFDHGTRFPGEAALLPCVGAALVIACGRGQHQTSIATALSWRPIVFVGLISYSLYLWHWPILVFARHYLLRPLEGVEATLLIALSVTLAIASWRFVERPFRGSEGLLGAQALLRAAGGLIVVGIVAGFLLDQGEGLPGRLPQEVRDVAAVGEKADRGLDKCVGVPAAQVSVARMCRINDTSAQPTFAVWGDSHAVALMPALGRAAQGLGVNGVNLTHNGCAPLMDVARTDAKRGAACLAFGRAVAQLLAATPELATVILVARWARHAEGSPYGDEEGDTAFLAGLGAVPETVESNRALFAQALAATMARLQGMGKRVVVVGPVPEAGIDVPIVLAKAMWRGRANAGGIEEAAYRERQRATLGALRGALPSDDALFIDLAPRLCQNQICRYVAEDGTPLYFDDNHLSAAGLRGIEGALADAFVLPAMSHAARER